MSANAQPLQRLEKLPAPVGVDKVEKLPVPVGVDEPTSDETKTEKKIKKNRQKIEVAISKADETKSEKDSLLKKLKRIDEGMGKYITTSANSLKNNLQVYRDIFFYRNKYLDRYVDEYVAGLDEEKREYFDRDEYVKHLRSRYSRMIDFLFETIRTTNAEPEIARLALLLEGIEEPDIIKNGRKIDRLTMALSEKIGACPDIDKIAQLINKLVPSNSGTFRPLKEKIKTDYPINKLARALEGKVQIYPSAAYRMLIYSDLFS